MIVFPQAMMEIREMKETRSTDPRGLCPNLLRSNRLSLLYLPHLQSVRGTS